MEIIIGFFGEIFAYIIFHLVIEGIGELIRQIYYWLRKLITGKEREIPELKRIEKRYLYKEVVITHNFHALIPRGTKGTILEVIDEKSLFVEFKDSNGKPIFIDDDKVFKVKRNKVRIKNRNKKN